jgi:hypothetical protein
VVSLASPCPACPLSPCSCLSHSLSYLSGHIVVCLNEAYMLCGISCQSLTCLSSVPLLLSPSLIPVRLHCGLASMRRTCYVISACPCKSLSCLSSVPLLLSPSLIPVRLHCGLVSMRRTCYVISACPCKSLSCLSSVPLLLSLPLSYLSGHIVVCLDEVADKGTAPGQSSGTAQLKGHI